MVTLYGTIVRELDARLWFRIEPALGDAADVGLAGEIVVARHQCFGIYEAWLAGELDQLKISRALAEQKAAAQRPRQLQGRRR